MHPSYRLSGEILTSEVTPENTEVEMKSHGAKTFDMQLLCSTNAPHMRSTSMM